MFSPSNDLFIFISTDCFLVKMTPYCLNPNLVLNLHAAVVLQSMITLVANSLSIKILLGCFFGSSTSSYLCFIWSERYFTLITCKILWCNLSFTCFLFNQNIYQYLLLFQRYFFHTFLCLHQPYLYKVFFRSFRIFYFSFILLYSFNTFTETNSS